MDRQKEDGKSADHSIVWHVHLLESREIGVSILEDTQRGRKVNRRSIIEFTM